MVVKSATGRASLPQTQANALLKMVFVHCKRESWSQSGGLFKSKCHDSMNFRF